MITEGFWKNRQNLNIESSIPAVISSFEDTGRVRALTKDLKNDERQHIFWESDLAKWLEGVFITLQYNPNNEPVNNAYTSNEFRRLFNDFKVISIRNFFTIVLYGIFVKR